MNGKMVGSKPLYVALAQRKEDRKAKLQVNIFLHGTWMYTACAFVCSFTMQNVLFSLAWMVKSLVNLLLLGYTAAYIASYFTCQYIIFFSD